MAPWTSPCADLFLSLDLGNRLTDTEIISADGERRRQRSQVQYGIAYFFAHSPLMGAWVAYLLEWD
jgi:hypothetical protein